MLAVLLRKVPRLRRRAPRKFARLPHGRADGAGCHLDHALPRLAEGLRTQGGLRRRAPREFARLPHGGADGACCQGLRTHGGAVEHAVCGRGALLQQANQAPKALARQWIGHGPWLHGCVSAVCAQAAPPLDG